MHVSTFQRRILPEASAFNRNEDLAEAELYIPVLSLCADLIAPDPRRGFNGFCTSIRTDNFQWSKSPQAPEAGSGGLFQQTVSVGANLDLCPKFQTPLGRKFPSSPARKSDSLVASLRLQR